jgi:FHA domain-containing protein
MILTLHAVSLNDQALTRPITARFDAAGGTIGRADHSTMALPDPERFISRKQAEVVLTPEGFMIRNVGAANPITVGTRTLAAGETTLLNDADEVRIGGYLLRAEVRDPARPAQPARPARPAAAQLNADPPTVGFGAARTVPGMLPSSALPPRPPPKPWEPPPQPLAQDNPFADLLGGAGAAPASAAQAAHAADPFADLLAGVPQAPQPYRTAPALVQRTAPAAPDDPFAGLMPAAAGLDDRSRGLAAGPPAPAAALPADFDPFAPAPPPPAAAFARTTPTAPNTPATPARAHPSDDPFAELLGSPASNASAIDDALGLNAPAGDDALARFAGSPAAGPMGGRGGAGFGSDLGSGLGSGSGPGLGSGLGAGLDADLSVDPLALFESSAGGAAPAPVHPPQSDNLAGVNAAYTPPRLVKPTVAPTVLTPQPPPLAPPARPFAPTAPSPTPARVAAAGRADDALWQAFCEGAGIRLRPPPGDGTDRMRLIGRIMRSAVEGTLQLMSVRASTKHEMRAAVTQIQVQGNNPLKFAHDAAHGLEQLLAAPARGFLDGPAAIDDAMHDLVGHAIGTVAGMRAALEGVLDRFDPAALEAKLTGGSMLDSLLPMNRRSRLWELYLQHQRGIREEAQEDFHTLFGKAFVAAYEQQIERLTEKRARS